MTATSSWNRESFGVHEFEPEYNDLSSLCDEANATDIGINTLVSALNGLKRKRQAGLVKLHVFTDRQKDGRRTEERGRN